jgi:hypothetical protein
MSATGMFNSSSLLELRDAFKIAETQSTAFGVGGGIRDLSASSAPEQTMGEQAKFETLNFC